MIGSLRTVPRIIRGSREAEPEELRAALAKLLRVDLSELFLTHGAHEANFLALAYLAGQARRNDRRIRVRMNPPEYPQLYDATLAVGGRLVPPKHAADVWILSNPNNPTGNYRPSSEIAQEPGTRVVLVDETFREFTDAPSMAASGAEKVWVTGTFTKVYGGDEIRVGWSVPPKPLTTDYRRFHLVASDKIAPRSIGAALAILASRREVLGEVRGIVGRNAKALHKVVRQSLPRSAPLWFDQGDNGLPANAVQKAALRRSILVSSGDFFGDPSGVRICLTRRSFPGDLAHYLAVRERFVYSRR
jgi:histidinol-phosphate/aromatic aminotransferase/cobyric acid decarboxylase-like protein